MARQRIHNQRAGRGGNSGASWISYSDMMAALLLVFVLILCVSLYQYFTMLESKEAELDEQRTLVLTQQQTLTDQSTLLAAQQITLGAQQLQLAAQQQTLDDQAVQLFALQTTLDDQQTTLEAQQIALAARETELTNLQTAFDAQTARIEDLIGVRSRIITTLSQALNAAHLNAAVDPTTGDIVLDSTVFFETGSSTIRPEGQALLNAFVPVYLNVLLSRDNREYLGSIIIEGHTDTSGDYFLNLELSQNRALSVAKYVLSMPSLTEEQRALLRSILTATGRSWSNPVFNADGSVNMDASRRVEFHFSLRDAEMIEEMQQLLQGTPGEAVVTGQ